MDSIQALADTCRVAKAHDKVLKTECAYTFFTPFSNGKDGIVVNLNTWMGTVPERAFTTSSGSQRGIFLRIVQERIQKEKSTEEEKEAAPTKLGVGVDGGFAAEGEDYEIVSTYSIVVLEAGPPVNVVAELPYTEETKGTFPPSVTESVESVINHVGMSLQQDVQTWQLDQEEIPVSKYAESLPFVDNGVVVSPDPSQWKCEKSGDTSNVWLNLSDGYMGSGRRNWDGSGGSNGALDHYNETGQKYPLVVKLGTITADVATADCYSYAPDEDGPVRVPNLKELLEKRGIRVASLQKTEKSTAELEVELNANYNFDAVTEAGQHLHPVSGGGLQGLQNLGNSCYMNSVVQMLLSGTVPELEKRYGVSANDPRLVVEHPLLTRVAPQDAPNDVLCQTTKLACALTSGVFAIPPELLKEEDQEQAGDSSNKSTDPKYRLAPRMFKHVVGKDHVDFCTGQQQDSAQFLLHLLELMDRAEQGASAALVKGSDTPLHVASHLFSFQTESRLVCSSDQRIKYKTSAPETMWSVRLPMDKAVVAPEEENKDPEAKQDDAPPGTPDPKRLKAGDDGKEEKKPIPTLSFATCIDEWAADSEVDDIRWPHLQNTVHKAAERTRFVNFPRYLIVQTQRYQLGPDWTPIKLEVNLDIPQEIDLNVFRSNGPQDGENLVPPEEEETSSAPAESAAPAIDEDALAQLMDMGFSLNGSKRALMAVGNDVAAATGWVFEHSMDADFNDPPPEPSSTGGAAAASDGVDEGVVQSLVENLGCFTADQVRAALKETSGAADRAADWLFSHMDDLDGAIAALQSKETASGSNAPKIPLEDGDGKYEMVGMISHIGKNTGSGHYVAHLKKDGKWVIFNDEKVALSAQPPFQHAYIYLFQRKDTMGSPHPNY